ncbi:MAG: diguanylate cyclase [Alphaproteobacteria bacterium]|nr:diguanylate cyclase [Alphaproteobacteria bacterium]
MAIGSDKIELPTMSAPDAERLLRFVNWKTRDERNAAHIRRVIGDNLDAILDHFYEHLTAFPELAQILDSPGQIARLKRTQGDYLLSLGRGMGTADYTGSRMRIGLAHDRVGLAPRWYIGAYAKLAELIGEYLLADLGHDPPRLIRCMATLRKAIQVDSILAVEAYHHAGVSRQEALLAKVNLASRQLEELVRTDELTGVLTRRSLLDALESECGRARRFRHPLTVLFIDIDRFKAINDLYGHVSGDKVLRFVARSLRESVRPADIVGRYGGEEFVVGLVECRLPEARLIAERMRARVETEARELTVGIAVTINVGTAVAEKGVVLEDLLTRADQAMYRAKAGGRNRVYSPEADVVAA